MVGWCVLEAGKSSISANAKMQLTDNQGTLSTACSPWRPLSTGLRLGGMPALTTSSLQHHLQSSCWVLGLLSSSGKTGDEGRETFNLDWWRQESHSAGFFCSCLTPVNQEVVTQVMGWVWGFGNFFSKSISSPRLISEEWSCGEGRLRAEGCQPKCSSLSDATGGFSWLFV